MDKAAENYQANKNRKRTVPELNEQQLRILVELVAQAAPTGQICRMLDLSEIDLDIVLHRNGLASVEDAKERLKEYAAEDAESELAADKAREDAREATRAAQERLDKREAVKAQADREAAQAAQEAVRERQDDAKDEDAERQRRFAEGKPKTRDLLEQYRRPSARYVGASVRTSKVEDSRFPPGLETDQFREMLLHRGLAFIRDQYDVTDRDIRNEMQARNIGLDFDLLPR